MKKTMKVIAILLVAVVVVMALSNTAFAKIELDFNSATSAISSGKGDTTNASASIGNMASAIINIVQIVGMAVAVVMLIVLAIKYISAAPSDKAEIKKHAVVYVVGAIVLFAATGILEIIKNFASAL